MLYDHVISMRLQSLQNNSKLTPDLKLQEHFCHYRKFEIGRQRNNLTEKRRYWRGRSGRRASRRDRRRSVPRRRTSGRSHDHDAPSNLHRLNGQIAAVRSPELPIRSCKNQIQITISPSDPAKSKSRSQTRKEVEDEANVRRGRSPAGLSRNSAGN